MKTHYQFALVSFLAFAVPAGAVTFSGNNFSGGGPANAVIRLLGSPQGQRFTPPGSVSVEADLEPGFLTLNSVSFDLPGTIFSETREVVDPITFLTTTYEATVTFDRFFGSFSSGPLALTSTTGGLAFDSMGMVSGSVTAAGTYSIVGPTSTVFESFSVDLPGTPNFSPLRGTLTNVNFPDSFDISFGVTGYRLPFNNPLEIFNETVDGQSFSTGISLLDLRLGTGIPLEVIPEPSALLLAGLGAVAGLGRRRRS